jgi:hypothetical protein
MTERTPEENTLYGSSVVMRRGHEMNKEFLNRLRALVAHSVEMDAVGLQSNSRMSEADILEHQRKCAELAARIRGDITHE